MKTVLLDGKQIHINQHDLPLLIHGVDGNGASHFSVNIIADLYNQGAKLLFISGFHMARDEFKEQTGEADTVLIALGDYVSNTLLEGKEFLIREGESLRHIEWNLPPSQA